MKYNRSLDLLCLAASLHAQGQTIKASKAFVAAVRDPSFENALSIVNSSNERAIASLKKPQKAKASAPRNAPATAASRQVASWPFATTANAVSASTLSKRIRAMDGMAPEEPMPGEEMREVPEENGDREIQEAFGEDDMSFLDDDGGELDLLEAASDEEDDEEESDDADDDAEDDSEGGDKEESATARFARYVRNTEAMRRQEAAKKKKKTRK